MIYYYDICDEANATKSKKEHLQIYTRNDFAKRIRMKYNIENPDVFDVDALFNEDIIIRKKKLGLYLVKDGFILLFDNEFYPHIKTEFQYNTSIFHQKRFLFNWIECFCERELNFSQIHQMSITAISKIRYTTFEKYFEQLFKWLIWIWVYHLKKSHFWWMQ